MPEKKSVAIIGGGIGGLAAALALRKTGIIVTVYERDEENARVQGYQIGINVDGFRALMTACPELDVDAIFDRQYGVTSISMTNANLDVLLNFGVETPKKDANSPGVGTVNRVALRAALEKGLKRNQLGDDDIAGILYGKRFLEYEMVGNKVVAKFEDGTDTGPVDILVGADGANSRVRRLLFPQIKYEPLGILNVAGEIELNQLQGWRGDAADFKLRSVLMTSTGASLLRAMDQSGSSILFILSQDPRTRKDVIVWVVTRRPEEKELTDFTDRVLECASQQNLTQLQAMLHAFCLDTVVKCNYTAEIQEIVRETGPSGMITFSFDPHTYQSRSTTIPPKLLITPTRVVLLGDAAHATTSHGGLGANTALADAVDLAEVIKQVKHDDVDIAEALAEYHRKMFKRGTSVIQLSTRNTGMITMGGMKARLRDIILRVVYGVIKLRRRLSGRSK